MNRLDYTNLPTPPDRSHPEYLEIDTGRSRRWMGLVAYLLFYLAVSGLLVFMFMQFTGSLALSVGVVAFMVTYMTVMGWLASRNVEKRQ